MNAPTLQALIFDVDGTLADTERDGHRVAFNAAFDEFGFSWHWSVDTYGELLAVTGGKERMRHYYEDYPEASNISDDFKLRIDELIIELHKSKTRHYTELLSTGAIPLRPGVERLLKEARAAGLRLAIATTTTPENVTVLLEHTLGKESIDWFEVIAAGDIVPAKKPAPDIYTYALEKMHLDANACLAFEDSENGIRSSQGANLTTIITVNGYTHDHDLSGAALILDNMGEPGYPFEVLAGDVYGNTMVNVDLLQKLHAATRA
jgi:HAD superfamily hydrolase (TIGR01509 family)